MPREWVFLHLFLHPFLQRFLHLFFQTYLQQRASFPEDGGPLEPSLPHARARNAAEVVMTTHPAWWMSEEMDGGVLAGSSAFPPLPPAGRLPFSAVARQPAPRQRGAETSAVPGEADAAGFATFPLASEATAPSAARGLTRSTLCGWGLADLADDACVVVSELVTNALRYGTPAPASRPRPLPPATEDEPILLSLVHHGGAVLCAVFDPGQDVPVVKEPDYFQETGRGLHVLASLVDSWGWTTPDRHGKAVWALLAAKEAEDTAGSAVGPADADWEPLTRLLLLLELLSGPSWLKALGASAGGTSSSAPAAG